MNDLEPDVRKLLTKLALLLLLLVLSLNAPLPSQGQSQAQSTQRSLLMAHYMPWYESPPTSQRWGWHWTMDHYKPATERNGHGQAASHYHPLIGFYDSNDSDVLECQVLLMKLAGIDGAIISWYGNDDYLDYAINHRNTLHFIELARKANLSFAIMYEDRTVPRLIAGGVMQTDDAVHHGHELMHWLQHTWFTTPGYLHIDDRPLFMVFGPQYYKSDDWQKIFDGLSPAPLFFTLQRPVAPAVGAFSWPLPAGGTKQSERELDAYYERAKAWKMNIPAAYPRFHDIYAEAGAQHSWGRIEDKNGVTYSQTLERALENHQSVVQLVTWNDWGEGSQIEPSLEFGYRDLETTQAMRRQFVDPSFGYHPGDLRLPVRLFNLKHKYRSDKDAMLKLDAVSKLLFSGDVRRAKKLLAAFGQ